MKLIQELTWYCDINRTGPGVTDTGSTPDDDSVAAEPKSLPSSCEKIHRQTISVKSSTHNNDSNNNYTNNSNSNHSNINNNDYDDNNNTPSNTNNNSTGSLQLLLQL